MNLQQKYDEIIQKFEIINTGISLQEEIYAAIESLAKNIGKGKKVAIVGTGEQGEELYKRICSHISIECFLDDEEKGEIEGIPIISLENINFHKIEVCFLASALFRLRDRKRIIELNENIEIIDVYDVFEKKGILLRRSFYQYGAGCYENIIFQRKNYKNEIEKEKKEKKLESLIYEYLYIKDFMNAFQCIEEYIQNNFSHKKKYNTLKHEIEELLNDAKKAMEARKGKDIFWFWNDQVEFSELKQMQYLSKIAENGMLFEKAYTTAPSTAPAMRGIFSQINRLDNFDVFYEKTDLENSKVLKVLQEEGYGFCYCGDSSIQRTFADCYCKKGNAVNGWCSSNIRIWEGICECLKSQKPMLILIHILIETHASYMSPNLEEYCFARPYDLDGNPINKLQKQIKASLAYIDQQQKFYSDILGEATNKIFMSDHGKLLTHKERTYENKMHHVMLIVVGKDLPKQKFVKNFSFIDFYKLIRFIIKKDKELLDDMFKRKIMHVQDVDVYNKIFVERLIDKGIKKYGWAFRAVYGEEDKYICFRTGEEHYYLLPDEETDYIKDSKYLKRIEKLKKENGAFFIDIEKEQKFQYSRLLYD